MTADASSSFDTAGTPAGTAARITSRITSRFDRTSTALQVVDGLSLHGRHVIVTGGASGLGLETSRAMAQAGASLTLAVRNAAQGDAAVNALGESTGQRDIRVALLDLADLASVARFADDWLRRGTPLHVLVNNAGIMARPLTRVGPGWESQFAINHLGHFALTRALLPALLASEAPRVVALSSSGHRLSPIHFDDIHFERREYNKWKAYGQAKTANALMALHLDTLHAKDGLTANAVHPGGIKTGLSRYISRDEMEAMGWVRPGAPPDEVPPGFKTVEQGAATTVWAATAPELQGHGGLYLEDCHEAVPSPEGERRFGYAAHIRDREAAARLWAVSEAMLAQA
ncbi:MAG: SDR family NAD(P)-dependent oxidoreductase [Rhizobacter sp.]|nr:SDR family NAD(P)-dependent oxidoreductase [Rhizobacter sp.]